MFHLFHSLPSDLFLYISDLISLPELLKFGSCSIDLDKLLSDEGFWKLKCRKQNQKLIEQPKDITWKDFLFRIT